MPFFENGKLVQKADSGYSNCVWMLSMLHISRWYFNRRLGMQPHCRPKVHSKIWPSISNENSFWSFWMHFTMVCLSISKMQKVHLTFVRSVMAEADRDIGTPECCLHGPTGMPDWHACPPACMTHYPVKPRAACTATRKVTRAKKTSRNETLIDLLCGI